MSSHSKRNRRKSAATSDVSHSSQPVRAAAKSRWWLGLLVAACVCAGGFALVLNLPPRTEGPQQALSEPNPAGYVGPQVCVECHQERVETFLATNHNRTSRLPLAGDLTGNFRPGSNVYQTRSPELHFEMTQSGEGFFQTVVQQTAAGEQRRTEQIGLVYGAGTIDEVYHYWQEDRLFQLPIAYVKPLEDWCNAPNYRDGAVNFGRETRPACLECHNTHVDHVSGTINRYHRDTMILGVTCERCHGPGGKHVTHHRSFPDDEVAQHIVHPGTLTRQQELDVCLQCHSEIEVRRQAPFSFRPGDLLEDFFRTHGDRHPEDDISANQIEGLRKSPCFVQTEMTCNTCHDPHIPEGPNNSAAEVNSCFVCHQPENCGARERLPEGLRGKCIDCHMPRKAAMNFTFHTRTEDYLPLIQRREHHIAAYPEKTQELLSEWYAALPDAASQKKAERIRSELAHSKQLQARELARDRRLRASSGMYREALGLTPNDVTLQKELQGVLDQLNELVSLLRRASKQSENGETDRAVRLLTEALRIKPNHTSALNGLGLALEKQEKFSEAEARYEQAIAVDPEFVDAYYNLGALKQSRGELAAAVDHYLRAVELAPFHADARMNLGSSYFLLKRNQEAVAQFREAVKIQPGYAEGHFNLAVALQSGGKTREASEQFRRACKAAPNWGAPQQQLAWILATSHEATTRNPAEAIRWAESACRTSNYRNPLHLDTLAAAFASAGNFDRAVKASDAALAAATEVGDEALASQVRQRRRLYQSKKPYRQASRGGF